ncbi:MAG: hypothetical protein AB2826_15670 [Candidatus Thiodiazotropha sp.]
MEELLFDYTLDSHKPLALNPPFLCNEALLLIRDIENDLIDEENLGHVLEELIWSIQGDQIAKSLLDADLDKYVLINAETPLKDKKIRLEVLSRTLESYRYLDACYDKINTAVVNIRKKEIDVLSRSLITTLINMGISKQYLYSKTIEHFYLGTDFKLNCNEDIDSYLHSIYPYTHDFQVYFICSDLINTVKESVKAFKVAIMDELPEDLNKLANDKEFHSKEGETYVEVKGIRCGDPNTARELADRRLDNLRDLFTLFNHKKQIEWNDRTLIRQCCLDNPVLIHAPKNSMEKGFDMKPDKASKELNNLIKKFAFKGGSFEKFNRIVDFHGIGTTNDISENQLLNIWIAIETLVPTHSGGSKINKITEMVIPFLLVNYVCRLVERFSADLLRWNGYKTRSILKRIPKTKGLKIYEKALHLLALKENEKVLDELYAALGDFHLLRYRAYQLSEVLNQPERIKELLEQHKKKVSWQIRRIYRTRNLIVHSGRTPKHIHSLIENGHDYLDQVLFEIIKMSTGEYRVRSFDQAFELAKLKYSVFNKKLREYDEFNNENIGFLLREKWGLTRP